MVRVAIVFYKGVMYWGNPSSGIWHFTEINGKKHFRAERKKAACWYNYEEQEKVQGVELGNNDGLFVLLRDSSRGA